MNDHSVHQWWSITISKRPVSSKNRLNLYGHSRNAVHSLLCLLFISFFFPFCNLKSILRKQIIMYVGMYRAACRHVPCHFEDPTCTLCTLQRGWSASASAVCGDREGVRFGLFLTPATACWQQHLLHQHVLLFEHKHWKWAGTVFYVTSTGGLKQSILLGQ